MAPLIGHCNQYPGLTWSVAAEDEATEICNFLLANFFPDEPLNTHLGLDTAKEVKPWLHLIVAPQLRKHVSIVARESETNEIAALSFNDVLSEHENDAINMMSVVEENKRNYPTMWKVVCFLEHLSAGLDLFQHCSVEAIGFIDFLSVAPRHRGRGLANHLVRLGVERMQELGYPILATKATSFFSIRALRKQGFSTLRRINYDASNYAKPHMVTDYYGIHKEACLMIREL